MSLNYQDSTVFCEEPCLIYNGQVKIQSVFPLTLPIEISIKSSFMPLKHFSNFELIVLYTIIMLILALNFKPIKFLKTQFMRSFFSMLLLGSSLAVSAQIPPKPSAPGLKLFRIQDVHLLPS